jgi:hypothetical protein
MPCVVCIMHVEMRSAGFLVEPENQGRRFVSGLASKPLGRFSPVWPQNWQLRFGDLCLKITVMVSWFGPQNHVGYGLSVAPQNRCEGDGVGHVLRSSACFAWKQFGLGFPSLASRLVEARWWVVHVAPSQRLHRVQVEDGWVDAIGCVGPCYPCFAVFFLLSHRGIVVF